jgi:hypothetical protein
MRTSILTLAALSSLAFAEPIAIDWERAKALHQRVSNGETLSAEDQKYYEEAKRQHDAGGAGGSSASAVSDAEMQRAKGIYERKQSGQTVSPEDEKFLAEAMRKRSGNNGGSGDSEEVRRAKEIQRRKQAGEKVSDEEEKFLAEAIRKYTGGGGGNRSERKGEPSGAPVASAEVLKALVPLTEFKGDYHGQDGGLYGGGSNEPPAALAARAKNVLAQIQPLDATGKPSAEGRIVFVSLGMSNTTMEFSTFKRLADADSRKSERVTIVDCAQGGRTAQAWAQSDQPWEEALRRIDAAKVTPAQVQVMWLKQANAGPSGGFPAATDKLRDDVRKDIERAREKYPNLRLIFLSSRIYGGYATTGLNPEPYAFEGAFAMREVIRTQPTDGPVLLWGPYLWTNGEKGRQLDDLKWSRDDCGPDGTHPSQSGQQKIAQLLLGFFTSNPYAKTWFTR